MDLEHNPGLQVPGPQFTVHCYHGNLHDVGRRTLDRRVHGHPLPELALHEVGGLKFRNRPSPAVKGGHIPLLLALAHQIIQEYLNTGISLKIFIDIFHCLFSGNAQILAEPECTDSINNTEIHCLGIAALERRYLCKGHVEYLRGSDGMDILGGTVRLNQAFIS